MAQGNKAAGAGKARSPGTGGPRIATVGLFACGAACVTLGLVWQYAHNHDATLSAQGASLAQQALQSHGLTWARVTERDGFVNIAGAAPSEAARVIAYQATRRALRPLMGREATVNGIRSLVLLKSNTEPLGRPAVSPPLDIAFLTPPPMPLVHETVRHAALETASAHAEAKTLAPTSSAVIETGSVTRTQAGVAEATGRSSSSSAAEMEARALKHQPGEREAAHVAKDEAARDSANMSSQDTIQLPGTTSAADESLAEPVHTAALDVTPPAAGTQPAPQAKDCADAFAEALHGTTINFARASAAIQKESRPLLDKLAAIAKRCKGYRLTVEGHTDLTGSSAANLSLSKKRAEAVRWALIDRGIDMDHIVAEGFGALRPLENSTSDEANAKNRRIAVTVSEAKSRR